MEEREGNKKMEANQTRASNLQIYSIADPLAAEPWSQPAFIDLFPF